MPLCAIFFDGECFPEDLLGLIPMEVHTTEEILFTKIVSFFEVNNLDLARVNMLVINIEVSGAI